MKKPIKLQFDENAPGRYWYLRWIGKITNNRGFKVELHFINSIKDNDYFYNFEEDFKQVQVVLVEALHFFTIGSIYDTIDNTIKRPDQYLKTSQIVSVKRKHYYNTSKKELPILDLEYSLVGREIDYNSLKYYWLVGKTDFIEKVKVIMPVHVFCNYFYFRQSNLITLIFNHTLSEVFTLENKKIISLPSSRVGYVKYDNTKIDRGQAETLAPFLFIKNNAGIKYIDAIGNNLVSFLYNNRGNKEILNKGIYLNTEIPFQDEIHFKIQGKHFHDGEGNNYLLAYRIVNHSFLVDNPLTVDEIRLERLFPEKRRKKKDRDTTGTGVRLIPPKPNSNTEITLDNKAGNSRVPIQENESQANGLFDLDIPIKHLVNDPLDEDYDPNIILTDLELDKATLNAYKTDPESEYLRQKYTASTTKINRFDLISLSIKCLKERYDVDYNFAPLDLKQSSKELYGIYENGTFHKVMVIELCYNNEYFYTVEFERGYTGFFHQVEKEQLIPFYLETFVIHSLRILTELKKGEHIWTIIRKKMDSFMREKNIVLRVNLSHQVKDYKNDLEAAEHMAKKIFYDRILKQVS